MFSSTFNTLITIMWTKDRRDKRPIPIIVMLPVFFFFFVTLCNSLYSQVNLEMCSLVKNSAKRLQNGFHRYRLRFPFRFSTIIILWSIWAYERSSRLMLFYVSVIQLNFTIKLHKKKKKTLTGSKCVSSLSKLRRDFVLACVLTNT